MTTKSTLFYGIFADVVQLAIATTIYFDLINVYNPLILELNSHRSSHNLAYIPNEIWQQIKEELKKALLISLKVDFATFLCCDCCKAGLCSDVESHSIYLHNDHASLMPTHPENTTLPNRECCIDLTEQRFDSCIETVEKWIFESIPFTMTKLHDFLSSFNLCLLNQELLGTGNDDEYRYALVIGADQVVVRDIANYSDRTELLELPKTFTSLSTSALRNFDYDSVDFAFQKLREDYGINGIDFKESQPIMHSSIIGPDEDLVPSWKLWFVQSRK